MSALEPPDERIRIHPLVPGRMRLRPADSQVLADMCDAELQRLGEWRRDRRNADPGSSMDPVNKQMQAVKRIRSEVQRLRLDVGWAESEPT